MQCEERKLARPEKRKKRAWEQTAPSVEASKAYYQNTQLSLKGQSILAKGLCLYFHLLDDEASPITEQGLDQ